MNFATVSFGEKVWKCVYDTELGFMCGRCKKLLGFHPRAPHCAHICPARVEEVSTPARLK